MWSYAAVGGAMGIGLGFGIGPLRVYVPVVRSRRRRRRTSRTRKSAPRRAVRMPAYHSTAVKPAFHGTVRLPDGLTLECHHAHQTPQAATECARNYIRTYLGG